MNEKQYPKLPEPEQATDDWSVGGVIVEYFTSDQMRSYVDADRAMRAAPRRRKTKMTDTNRRTQETPPALAKTFTAAQRERMFRNRPSDVGKGLSLADWHRVVQYVEACHGINPKEQSND